MRYTLLIPLLFFLFCKREVFDVHVTSPAAGLLEKPSPGSRVVANLSLDDGLTDLGEVSGFESSLGTGQTEKTMPWIEVENRQGQKGWVWMGWVSPLQGDSAAWVRNKRLLCYLGKEVYKQYQQVQELHGQLTPALHYQRSMQLRDSMVYALHHRPDAGKTTSSANWVWLTEAMPGFVLQRIDQGSRPYLFADYKYWRRRALNTAETTDDLFFETMFAMFPADSIESFFPVWTIQTDENAGCSQLGLGNHISMLQRIDEALTACPEFEPELIKVKNLLLEDMLGKDVCYWQTEKKILTELNLIIENNYKCLTSRDVLALKARKPMFENPLANGIRVNLRAGEVD
ncbi:MAG: SH3 domain-containing protein [Saprospiraceae bacterium]|nr:SH3 domain-containing protein [Saprospiraceae bacterium]MCC6414229.1 SH3 domain-containing protein [Saprospiraceae bacterium]